MGPGATQGAAVHRTALTLAVAAALTALTAMSACTALGRAAGDRSGRGDDASRARAVAALRSADRSTDGAGSARVESTTTMGAAMSMRAVGTLSWEDGLTGGLTLTYTGGAAADALRRLGSTSTAVRYLPDASYARMGDAFAAKARGRHWVRHGYEDLDAGMRATTPHESVRLLLASGDVTEAGRERVRGERTTHYRGTVDVAGLAARKPGPGASRTAELGRQLARAGVVGQTVDVWIDDRDLLVKKVERARTTSGEVTQTAYFTDYGAKVSVQAPPAGDTADLTDLVGAPDGRS
ncbi:hypothetical protein ACPF8X_12575 [Streptomyces sp. G35A]